MINKGNIANAIKELKSNKNNAVAHIFDKKTLNEGKENYKLYFHS